MSCQQTIQQLGGMCPTYDVKSGQIVSKQCTDDNDCSDKYTNDYCSPICIKNDDKGNCTKWFSYPDSYQKCCNSDGDFSLEGNKCTVSNS